MERDRFIKPLRDLGAAATSLPAREFSPAEKERWRSVIFGIYHKMRATREPYEIQCGDLSLTVLPNVYAPKFFTDSLWFAQQLPDIVGKKSLLEIGTGTGIIAIFCARNGAHIVATDINPDALKNARINAARHHLAISVREGSLYEPIEPDEKFDFIFWAHPFNNWETPVDDMLLRSGMDYHYEGLKGYIAGAKNHLDHNSKLLLGTGDSADLKTIASVAKENGYSLKLLRETDMSLEEEGNNMIKYLLYEFAPY